MNNEYRTPTKTFAENSGQVPSTSPSALRPFNYIQGGLRSVQAFSLRATANSGQAPFVQGRSFGSFDKTQDRFAQSRLAVVS